MSEHQIQSSIMAFLNLALPSSYRAFAVPNGGRRDKITGAILKREGVKAGVPDIIVVRDGGSVAFIEVKKPKGVLSEAQKEWRDWCAENRVPWGVVRNVSDVETFLTDLNVPLKARAA